MAQKVMKFMMIFMGVLFFKVPSGLCLYFITSSIWGIAERKMLPKPKLDTDSLAADDAEGSGKKNARRSLFGKAENSPSIVDNSTHLEEKKRRDKERKKKLKRRGN
jgi:YidC/Oxa1 family membrane protein insertase